MLTMGQKVIAMSTLLFLNGLLFLFGGLVGLIVGLFATGSVALAILFKL